MKLYHRHTSTPARAKTTNTRDKRKRREDETYELIQGINLFFIKNNLFFSYSQFWSLPALLEKETIGFSHNTDTHTHMIQSRGEIVDAAFRATKKNNEKKSFPKAKM